MRSARTAAVLLAVAACTGPTEREQRAPTAPTRGGTTATTTTTGAPPPTTTPPSPTTAQAPRRTVELVVEPAALVPVSTAGGSLAALLGAPAALDNAALIAASPRYVALVDRLTADLEALAASTPRSGVGVRGTLHRLFDARWLRSPSARFELVGVAPRLDRARPPTDCGDVRLIFRLAYEVTVRGERIASRLPMTVSISLAPRSTDCAAEAGAWRAPEAIAADPAALGAWLVSADGPLGRGALAPARVVLVLSNLQTLRTPAAAQRSLGGHAEYRLRAFAPAADGALAEAALENTPDVARIRGDAALRGELLAWLRDEATLAAIDHGVHRLPDHLLAKVATSVSPYGFARPANRSFGALVDASELAALPLAGRATIATPEALLRRLDEQTCHGCHQVRSLAGFHLVGEDPPGLPAGVALAVAYSPLVTVERARRGAVIEALATDGATDLARPTFEAEVPPSPAPIGGACDLGPIVPSPRGAGNDGRPAKQPLPCARGLSCTPVRGGFPGGMCQARCAALPDGAVCGVIAATDFNSCLGSGEPFSTCMRHVRPVGLASCDVATPCRDDYVCARTPAGEGACLPPYFLFPLRVDGHPL